MDYTEDWALEVWNAALLPYNKMVCGACEGSGSLREYEDEYKCDLCGGSRVVTLGDPINAKLTHTEDPQVKEILEWSYGPDLNDAYLHRCHSLIGATYNGWYGRVKEAVGIIGGKLEGEDYAAWLQQIEAHLLERCDDWSLYPRSGMMCIIWK